MKTEQDQYSLTNDTFAWRTSFIGVVIILVAMPIIDPESYIPIYKFLKDGVLITLVVTVGGICLSSVIGIVVGIGREWSPILNRVLSIYVEVVRGIPLLVQLVYIYFVIGKVINFDRVTAAVIALGFCYGAYMAEIVRSGLSSVPKGQVEAAISLGMTKFQRYRLIIVPQALRIILPPYGNEFIAMLKDSSLVSIIAVADIMQKAKIFSSANFNYFQTYSIVALFYLLLTLFFSKSVAIIETRFLTHKKRR